MNLRAHRTRLVWLLTATFGAGACALWLSYGSSLSPYPSTLRLPWWALAPIFAITEVAVIHVLARRETQTFSLSEIPLVLGLFFATPSDLVAAQILGAAFALIVYRRQPAVKWAFNLAQLSLTVLAASTLFRLFARPDDLLGSGEIEAAFLATGAAIVLGTLAVMLVLTIAEGRPRAGLVLRNLGFGALGTVTNTSIALLAVVVLRRDPTASWLLAVPALAFFFAYRGYVSYRQEHQTLATFADATRTVQSSLELEPAMRTVLERARDIFRTEIAYATFLPQRDGEPAMQARIDVDGEVVVQAMTLDPTEGVWARVVAEGRSVVLARPIENERLREHFAAMGVRDVMVAPLPGRDGPIGVMGVGNRRGDVVTFGRDDLRLFEAFVNHIGVALENVRLLAQLQLALGSATERDRLKDEFLTTLSHELRGPITALLTNVDMLRAGEEDERIRDAGLRTIGAQANQLRSLVEDLVMDVRLAGNAVEPVVGPIRTGDLLERVIATARPWAEGHVLAVFDHEDIPTVVTDPDMLHRILTNLVSNAVKNSPQGSRVTIRARREDDTVVFSVTDEGVGIPAEVQHRIFERFVHMDRTPRRSAKGIGLGLSICLRLADMIGAHVWLVRSEPGKGSEFAVRVPIRRRATAPATAPAPPAPGAEAHPAAHTVQNAR